ncbi:MAG TPA: hypothetical protein VIV60_35460 [Polyangiaceae bacterium]
MSESLAEILNRDCRCVSFDLAALDRETRALLGDSSVGLPVWSTSLFAAVPVFVSREDLAMMRDTILAVDSLVRSPKYRERVLAHAPEIARHDVSQRGVYFGYDFHLGELGPALIEINTNAGGPLLNLLLARAQTHCDEMEQLELAGGSLEQLESEFVAMFRREWVLARGNRPLRSIAIVDDEPEKQFLYSEFLLFQSLFQNAGLKAFVLRPEQLQLRPEGLYFGEEPIDLVYNRLVDFYLAEPAHQTIRDAYLADTVVVTPHPQAHALYANKRNLITLRDLTLHEAVGLSQVQSQQLLAHIPETQLVEAVDAERLWSERKRWFFKPLHGYGGKAAYRGDKLTRATFAEILGKDYVVQRNVAPSQRHVEVGGSVVPLKLDLRCFVYDTSIQLVAARLYHGQTTNFRTAGGGFAPVFSEINPGRSDP